jgi:hypothetical protein
MKNLIITFILAIFIISCNDGKKEETETRYTQDSKEINTLKALLSDYEKADWESFKKHYSDTANIYHNSKKSMSVEEIISAHQESLTGVSGYSFPDEEDEFEMVLTDDKNTWVNYWGEWQGTIAENDEEVIIPVHITAQFIDGKIVTEHAYYDNNIMFSAIQNLEMDNKDKDSINSTEP